MCGRGAPSSGQLTAVRDRRGARRPPDSLSLGLCLSHKPARTHEGAHTFSFPAGRPQHLHLLTCHKRPLPGFPFPPGQAPSAMPAPGSLPVTPVSLSLCQNLGILVYTCGSQTLLHILVWPGAFRSPDARPRPEQRNQPLFSPSLDLRSSNLRWRVEISAFWFSGLS